jgi:hypothetical protein
VNSPQAGATDVSVAVNPADAGAVACDAAAGNVAVVVLPTARAAASSAPSPPVKSPAPAGKR